MPNSSCEHPMRSGWPHLFVSQHELAMTKLQWSNGQLILWARKLVWDLCDFLVRTLHISWLYGSPCGYWRNYKYSHQETRRVCHISANSQGTHRELTSVTSPIDIMMSSNGVRLQNDVAVKYLCEVAVSISQSPHDIFVRSNSSLGRYFCLYYITTTNHTHHKLLYGMLFLE